MGASLIHVTFAGLRNGLRAETGGCPSDEQSGPITIVRADPACRLSAAEARARFRPARGVRFRVIDTIAWDDR